MIQFNNVVKTYKDGAPALKGINLEIKAGELVTLIGPSGCGKTTTMKMINRLVEPTSGTILVDGQDISKINPIELRRNIGYVIQHIGLFPHMKIKDNVEIVPRLKKMDKAVYERRTDELMDMVGLDPTQYKNRYPAELSGGQQQRIGVIRAMAAEPSIILMDEPFSALDPISREQLQDELIRLQEEVRKTIVFVSHDMDEALKIADRIVLMQGGEIVQADTPEHIIRRPKNDFVRTFIGEERLNHSEKLVVEDVMLQSPVTVHLTRGLAYGAMLMRQHRVNGLLVIDKNRILKGFVTKDMLEAQFRQEDLTLQDIMRTDIPSVTVGTGVAEAVEIMKEHGVHNLPVIKQGGQLAGLVTNSSLIDALLKQL
ncbi:betaine/proline/choline family ABC transporter ATP-binding protein [Paenibacillus sacheonensis]|uniref:Quaternary amine transport ATP-binding protein n=1 Tax=Paenibacillus sacheonensis TaxID=742054 RepID=A0A7X5BZ18_9BACL|nr:betaine/proline/choline family ABC transporter ATP-binding protein [Paenibacillus sacheonensis]MBM7564965.1 osmoprotectant transport system ATP-binding protein [Paenibacillus sacheonensis]NBC70247.1 betaine/proline/choline family ABC transporter ATP-binding protein [Paenibacillus sacheonensis]